MSARRVLQPARLLWLAPAFFGLLASQGAARAGCGDHARSTASGLEFGLASLAESVRTVDLPSPTAPSRPCNGPSCSGQRREAPAATPPAPRIAPERGLVALRVEPPRAAAAGSALARRRPAYEPPAPGRPDRPPRP